MLVLGRNHVDLDLTTIGMNVSQVIIAYPAP
jgi:hypothetical protein